MLAAASSVPAAVWPLLLAKGSASTVAVAVVLSVLFIPLLPTEKYQRRLILIFRRCDATVHESRKRFEVCIGLDLAATRYKRKSLIWTYSAVL